MDLNTITAIVRPRRRAELPVWQAGDAWLAGGTWLFSEPQPSLTRLIDIVDFGWPALQITEQGLQIAATCKIAELDGDDISVQLDRHAAVQSMLPVVPRLIQNLEHGDGRRQSLHGVAGGADDCADRGIGWHVHDLDAGRRRTARCRHRFCIGAATQCTCAGRVASLHRVAAFGAAPAYRLSANLARPAWPLGRVVDWDIVS